MQLISGIRSGLLWARGALAGFGLRDGARDFVEIGRREIELPGSDPAVYLCGGSRADNRSGDAAPAERPGAVSYTHLDVYKRQTFPRVRSKKSALRSSRFSDGRSSSPVARNSLNQEKQQDCGK